MLGHYILMYLSLIARVARVGASNATSLGLQVSQATYLLAGLVGVPLAGVVLFCFRRSAALVSGLGA